VGSGLPPDEHAGAFGSPKLQCLRQVFSLSRKWIVVAAQSKVTVRPPLQAPVPTPLQQLDGFPAPAHFSLLTSQPARLKSDPQSLIRAISACSADSVQGIRFAWTPPAVRTAKRQTQSRTKANLQAGMDCISLLEVALSQR
jgi:hypothetical protein